MKIRSLEIAKELEIGDEVEVDWGIVGRTPLDIPNGLHVVTEIVPCPQTDYLYRVYPTCTNCVGQIRLNRMKQAKCLGYTNCFPFKSAKKKNTYTRLLDELMESL